jgi:acetyltransferase-like isoleucine patch superfamily enzyme
MKNYYFFCWLFRALIYKLFFGRIGFLSFIGKPTFLRGTRRIYLGKSVHIFPNIRLEVVNKDAKIEFKDNVSIAQNVHITAGGELIINKSTSILANVCITDIDHEYADLDINIRRQNYLINKTEIGENCMIGMGAIILAGTFLGKQNIVAANSVVKGIYPDYCVIAGAPARIVKIYNLKSEKWEKYER